MRLAFTDAFFFARVGGLPASGNQPQGSHGLGAGSDKGLHRVLCDEKIVLLIGGGPDSRQSVGDCNDLQQNTNCVAESRQGGAFVERNGLTTTEAFSTSSLGGLKTKTLAMELEDGIDHERFYKKHRNV